MESKKDKFVRIAEARTNKIIDMIRLLGNCSNKASYEYSKEELFDLIVSNPSAYEDYRKNHEEIDLSELDFSGLTLEGVDLTNADLSGCSFG